jgi:hypothetical protein
LRPDGDYTYPAIVHDYLYWEQTRSRAEADEIFKLGMEEFGIGAATIWTIYTAVQKGGAKAWEQNARAKEQGERRHLAKLPDDPRVRWADWKKVPGVFSTPTR